MFCNNSHNINKPSLITALLSNLTEENGHGVSFESLVFTVFMHVCYVN